MWLSILVAGLFVFGISYIIFKAIKTKSLPSNNYTPSDDIDQGKKDN
jgi:hypothetical protein